MYGKGEKPDKKCFENMGISLHLLSSGGA